MTVRVSHGPWVGVEQRMESCACWSSSLHLVSVGTQVVLSQWCLKALLSLKCFFLLIFLDACQAPQPWGSDHRQQSDPRSKSTVRSITPKATATQEILCVLTYLYMCQYTWWGPTEPHRGIKWGALPPPSANANAAGWVLLSCWQHLGFGSPSGAGCMFCYF